MRICHVIESGGGSGQVVVDLTRAALAAGDEVTVIYAPGRASPAFVEALSSMSGLKLIALPMRREVGMHDMWHAWRLYRCLRRNGPFDVIHAHSSKAGALVRIIGVLLPGAIKVYMPHALITLDPKAPRHYGRIEKILSWFGDGVLALSITEEEHATKELGINKRKVFVVPNGIRIEYPADRATARHQMGYLEKDILVGFVGRFVPQKNPVRLIEAFALAIKAQPDLQLAMVGDGPLQFEIERETAKHGLVDKIRFFKGKTGRDLMPGFDCLVCSSDYEGFAIIFLEALAAGVPIVTTPVGGSHETVVQGQTGYMTADFTPESLAKALLQLTTSDVETRQRMSKNARDYVQQFETGAVMAKMRALYQRLIDRKTAS